MSALPAATVLPELLPELPPARKPSPELGQWTESWLSCCCVIAQCVAGGCGMNLRMKNCEPKIATAITRKNEEDVLLHAGFVVAGFYIRALS